jgi:hypothetical protein
MEHKETLEEHLYTKDSTSLVQRTHSNFFRWTNRLVLLVRV